jgi:hypothetical protein
MKNLTVFEARKMTGVFNLAAIDGVNYAELSGEVFIVSGDFGDAMYRTCRANAHSPWLTDAISALIKTTLEQQNESNQIPLNS